MTIRSRTLDTATGRCTEYGAGEIAAAGAGQVVWIDLDQPTRSEVDEVGKRYALHHLAIEDCWHDGQRPKLDSYEGYIFMVLHHPAVVVPDEPAILREVDVFLGAGYLITSHLGPFPALDVVLERWIESPESAAHGASFLAYLLADTIVDDYFPVLDNFESRLAELDERVFLEPGEKLMQTGFKLKRELVLLRRVVGPTRDAFVWLLRHEAPLISQTTVVHFQDVYDHLIRISDTLDLYRDLAASVQEAYLATIANRTNASMKRLTALSTSLMSVTLVASIYGMNFKNMPELSQYWGYYFALGMMGVIALANALIFKLRGYF